MAEVGSSLLPNKNVTVETYTDVTATGHVDVGLRRFTTWNNLVTGSHYRFVIQAYNGVKESVWSDKSDRIITALVPSAPRNLMKESSTKT